MARERGAAGRTAFLAAWLLIPAAAPAAIWPEQFGAFDRTSLKPFSVSDRSIWLEYGLEDAEQAVYGKDGTVWTATAIRLHDSTGAMAAFQWQRPAGAKPARPEAPPADSAAKPAAKASTPQAVESPGVFMIAHGNYLLTFSGRKPSQTELDEFYQVLPRLEQSPLPLLKEYLPTSSRIAGSERYVLGPVALEKFDPGLPASTAAFHLGAEAQIGRFRSARGETTLAIFSYPTPLMARERAVEFQKVQGALVKRTGPLVAVVLSPPDPDEAERLLAQIRYQATVAWSEYVPSSRDNIGTLIVNIFILIGFLLVFGVVAGVAYGGVRTFRRNRSGGEPDALTSLHLGGR
jgi:hypothetical protein